MRHREQHGPDAPTAANILLDSTGGSIAEVAITGCTIQHNHSSPDSANIRIPGAGVGPRKQETKECHVTITGNVLSDVMVNIHLRDARGVTIVVNTFWSALDRDLRVEGSRNVVVRANNFDRNPRYSSNDERTVAPHGLVFRDSVDCSLDGLVVSGVRAEPAAVVVENCRRFNITDCTVLDSDHPGLLLRGVADSRVSDCLIRDDGKGREPSPAFRLVGGAGTWSWITRSPTGPGSSRATAWGAFGRAVGKCGPHEDHALDAGLAERPSSTSSGVGRIRNGPTWRLSRRWRWSAN